MNDFHPQSPNFAPFASLRETLRVSVAALSRWVLRGHSQYEATLPNLFDVSRLHLRSGVRPRAKRLAKRVGENARSGEEGAEGRRRHSAERGIEERARERVQGKVWI